MKKTREINIKPSCMSEIHGFPADQTAQLWEKINYLVGDPLPDGKLKKKLRGQRDLYRLRVGGRRFPTRWARPVAPSLGGSGPGAAGGAGVD